ncbi:MAG: SH3 domain-containing protein [Desulforhopalus sp.]|nr:SH3 domain-containing protein [Desulforhopalus sp.]
MTGFTLFNHRQIFSLVLSTTLVFALSSSVWARNDHDGHGNGNQHDSRMGTANGGGSVGMTLRKAVQKSESYKRGGVPSRGPVERRSPQAQNRSHKKQDYYKKEWKHWGREYTRSPWEYRHRPRYGSIHRALPTNHFRFLMGGVPFFYSAGVYFQPGSQGYVVVAPPLGGRVQILPEGCSSFYYGDRRCYSCDDVFYEERGAEYVVINQPSSYRLIADAGDEVEIDISALNLRSGPGGRYDILTTLHQGEIAEVDAVNGDWYSVILEDGTHGWIKRQYTRIISFKEDPKG